MAEKREKEIYKVTLVGGVVNFLLMVFKFVAGIVGHSSAMIADAVHSLSDFVTDIIVVVLCIFRANRWMQTTTMGMASMRRLLR